MSANEKQIGGTHYKGGGEEHWDRVHRLGLDYFQAQITKYVERCWLKNGVQDLEKARHFIDKYIELNKDVLPPILTIPRGVVKPTGWKDFTYEATKDDQDIYRCTSCREYVKVPVDDPPTTHACTEPGRGYVDQ